MGIDVDPDTHHFRSEYLNPPSGARNVNLWRKGQLWFDMHEEQVEICGVPYILCVFSEDHPHIDPVWVENAVEISEVMVHRFRSTLTGIMGFSEMLGLRVGEMGERAKDEFEAIDLGLKSMQDMLNTLDAFRQIPTLELKPTDLNSLIKEIAGDLKQMGEKRIRFEVKGTWQRAVLADAQVIKEIIYAIVENAIDALQYETEVIELITDAENGEIKVRNTAAPIPSKDEGRIFHPFFTTKAKNLGLGLSRAALLAERMGMYLYLKSNNNIQGVIFALDVGLDGDLMFRNKEQSSDTQLRL
jgi:signal transduction histidine kinase